MRTMVRICNAGRTVTRQAADALGKGLGSYAMLKGHRDCHSRIVEEGIEKRALFAGFQE